MANLVRFSSSIPSPVTKDTRGWLLDPISLARASGILGGAFTCASVHIGEIRHGRLRGNHSILSLVDIRQKLIALNASGLDKFLKSIGRNSSYVNLELTEQKLTRKEGAMAIAVTNPTDLVKVRLQAEGKFSVILEKLRVVRKNAKKWRPELGSLINRKWKEIVDEWVRLNQPGGTASLMDGSYGFDCNTSEAEPKPKVIPRKEALPKSTPPPSVPTPSIAFQNRQREQRDRDFDAERLASARKRLQENYKEAENGGIIISRHVVASLTERSLCLIQNQSQCLADLCGALHYDIEINFGLKKSKCNPVVAARNKHLCEVCIKFFLHQFCDAHSCTGSRQPFSKGHRRDKKGNSTVKAHLSNWKKEKTILMDRSIAFGSSRFSNTFRIHRSLLICDSGYCTPNSAIGECSWRRRARKTAKSAPYFTCLFPLANMQTFPPSNAGGRIGQVYQPITAQTAAKKCIPFLIALRDIKQHDITQSMCRRLIGL
ncbi:putative mediator of RNA polymerase II transcription subunit 26c [Arachis hypogaea]|nr:putative mediator of RNA polymerase II transcription subunit 26c [Arachis hypogaea]